MKTIIHKADSRGHANYGWLDTYHTFSFSEYYDPSRTHFGKLRVINDDTIAGGQGFGQHPHDNMEIITIVLEGELEHKDSMGNTSVIHPGEVQVMTAGTGIFHSEFNHTPDVTVRLFQIWVFPDKKGHTPRYDQKIFAPIGRRNLWQTIVSPTDKEALFIHQDATFSRIDLDKGKTADYTLKNPDNIVYFLVIEGSAEAGGSILNRRDGAGFSETTSVSLKAVDNAQVLVMEVPA
jgi:redox-sensitive bicupin YhaK (pirin superfamily)